MQRRPEVAPDQKASLLDADELKNAYRDGPLKGCQLAVVCSKANLQKDAEHLAQRLGATVSKHPSGYLTVIYLPENGEF